MPTDDPLPPVFSRAQARAAGLTDRQIDRRLASGALQSLGRGIAQYRPDAATGLIIVPPDLAAALISTAGRDAVLSHASAAHILGLPKPMAGWSVPQLTAANGPTRRRSGVHILVAPLTDQDVMQHKNVPITRPARTVIDCLRTLPPPDGLAILDAALHRAMVTMEQLLAVLESQRGWPGVARAREVLPLGDGRRESPLESWSAWSFHQNGVSPLQWQMEIRDQRGRFAGRADCWWEGVAGEADGRSKYALAAAQRGGASADALYDILAAERRREQRLRDTGAEVVRWSTADVRQPDRGREVARRIQQACALAAATGRFTGLVAPVVLQLATIPRPPRGRKW